MLKYYYNRLLKYQVNQKAKNSVNSEAVSVHRSSVRSTSPPGPYDSPTVQSIRSVRPYVC